MRRTWSNTTATRKQNNIAKAAFAVAIVGTVAMSGLALSNITLFAQDAPATIQAEPVAEVQTIQVEKVAKPAMKVVANVDDTDEIAITKDDIQTENAEVVDVNAEPQVEETKDVVAENPVVQEEVVNETPKYTKDDYMTMEQLAELSDEDLDAFIDAHTDPVTGFIDLTAGRDIVPTRDMYNEEGQRLYDEYIAQVEWMKANGIPLIQDLD